MPRHSSARCSVELRRLLGRDRTGVDEQRPGCVSGPPLPWVATRVTGFQVLILHSGSDSLSGEDPECI